MAYRDLTEEERKEAMDVLDKLGTMTDEWKVTGKYSDLAIAWGAWCHACIWIEGLCGVTHECGPYTQYWNDLLSSISEYKKENAYRRN